MEQVNHLSLNLAGDLVLDPPSEVALLDPLHLTGSHIKHLHNFP